VEIQLKKTITCGPGLAGDSSDAAAATSGLASAFREEIVGARLMGIARFAGADCRFFLWTAGAGSK